MQASQALLDSAAMDTTEGAMEAVDTVGGIRGGIMEDRLARGIICPR